jgi:hypothetical protein
MKKASSKKAVSPVVAEKAASAFTIAALQKAVTTANENYKKKHALKANLNKNGFNPDLAKAHKIVSGMTETQLQEIEKLQVAETILASLQDATNTKKPMRILQAALFTVTGSGQYLKGSAKTFLLEFCGLVVAGAKTRKALAMCATGVGFNGDSDEMRSTAKARELIKAFGVKTKPASEQTQNSVSFSNGGIAATLGVAKKDTRTGLPVVNLESPVVVKLNDIVSKLSDSSLQLLVAQASERSN